MFDTAITVRACLQAGTRADVAWLVDVEGLIVDDWSDTVAFTPGGGKTGLVLGGAIDGKLADLAGRWGSGRLVEVEVNQIDALIAELPATGSARCVIAPADSLPADLWAIAIARETFCLVGTLEEDVVSDVAVFTAQTISDADPAAQEILARGVSGSILGPNIVVSVFVAVPQMVIVGSGPIVEALAAVALAVGWKSRVVDEANAANGLITSMSTQDKVVIAAHDLELAGAGLASALGSACGYIGSVGSRKMQIDRADWLAYRGVTDISRVHGPAGLDISAVSPGEIAVAIVAEAIAESSTSRP